MGECGIGRRENSSSAMHPAALDLQAASDPRPKSQTDTAQEVLCPLRVSEWGLRT